MYFKELGILILVKFVQPSKAWSAIPTVPSFITYSSQSIIFPLAFISHLSIYKTPSSSQFDGLLYNAESKNASSPIETIVSGI